MSFPHMAADCEVPNEICHWALELAGIAEETGIIHTGGPIVVPSAYPK